MTLSNFGELAVPKNIFRASRGYRGKGNAGQSLVSPDSSYWDNSAKIPTSTAEGLISLPDW